MTLSLLGIIFVQGYWIVSSYQTKEDQFDFEVEQALREAENRIQLGELEDYYNVYSGLIDSTEAPSNVTFSELIYRNISDEDANEIYIFSDGILEQDYKFAPTYSESDNEANTDTVNIKKFTNTKKSLKISKGVEGSSPTTTTTETFSRLKDYQLKQFEEVFQKISAKTPIHKRISEEKIRTAIQAELDERDIKSKFEFAIYSNNLITKIKSDKFKLDNKETYSVPFFLNDTDTKYTLSAIFSERQKLVLSTILGMALLSLVFTAIIMLTFYSALSQIFKQRQIAEIKTDFINNMTHEFKTPIATINLALDALKNPKVKDKPEFLERYLGMIREENKRMHSQVENVLRISKLDKNELNLTKDRLELHEVIEDSITHVSLMVEDRGGYIKTHLGALKSEVLANESHLTNVIVNLLDNAIKYSEDIPKIDVYTENVRNNIILKIRDQGMGMNKQVQKKIFDKFYREHTGDIHNVKGHGLGLSYVKRVLDDHDAQISVESDKGKGSTFIIKLHLIQ